MERPPWLARGERAAQTAITLNPGSPGAHATLGAIYQAAGRDYTKIDAEFSKALRLDPDHVTARQWYGEFLMTVGRSREFLEAAEAAHDLDPLAPVVNASLAWAYLYNYDFERAERFALTALELGMGGTWAEDVLGLVYIYSRQYDSALEVFTRDHPDFALNRLVVESIADPAKVPDTVAAIEAVDYSRISYWPVELMMLVGETDTALELTLAKATAGGDADIRTLWRPHFLAQAGDPRYRKIVEQLNLPAYWDRTSWPDICRRAGDEISCDPAYISD